MKRILAGALGLLAILGPEADAGLVRPSPWTRPALSVCWAVFGVDETHAAPLLFLEKADAAETRTRREFLEALAPVARAAVEREFVAADVGLSFAGWERCVPGKAPDVVFLLASDAKVNEGMPLAEASQVGRRKLPGRAGRPASVVLDVLAPSQQNPDAAWVISPEEYVAQVAIHEFAHLAGLLHELPPSTSAGRSGPDRLRTSVYDADSIMNYGFVFMLGRRLGYAFERSADRTRIRAAGRIYSAAALANRGFAVTDPSVFAESPAPEAGWNALRYRIRLSAGDRNALRCLSVYGAAEKKRKCRPDYDPLAGG